MCYSAMVLADLRKLERSFDAAIDVDAYDALVDMRMQAGRVRIPKAMDDALVALDGPAAEKVRAWRQRQAEDLLRQLAEQEARLHKAREKLAVRETKAALNDVRVATNKIAQFSSRLPEKGSENISSARPPASAQLKRKCSLTPFPDRRTHWGRD